MPLRKVHELTILVWFAGATPDQLHTKKKNQKNPRVRKMFVWNSGAGNGCANFVGGWKNAFFLQEKPHVHKFPALGEGGIWVFFLGGGGGECRFYFYGREDFSERNQRFPSVIS